MLSRHLIDEFEQRSKANPRYSLRAFARDLEIGSGALSLIMNQKRAVGTKVIAHLMTKLPLTTAEKKSILSDLMAPKKPLPQTPQEIDEAILTVIQDWEHFAILAFLKLRRAIHTTEHIARALGLHPSKVTKALANLEDVGLLKQENKIFKVLHKALKTSSEVPSTVVREAHQQYIDKAKEALNEFSIEERDITGTTIVISSKNLPKAKEVIRQFRLDLVELLEQGEVDEVYRLNIQLFPLTKKVKKDQK